MEVYKSAVLLDEKLRRILSEDMSDEDAHALEGARNSLNCIMDALRLSANLDDVIPASRFVCIRLLSRCSKSSYSNELIPMVEDFQDKIKSA